MNRPGSRRFSRLRDGEPGNGAPDIRTVHQQMFVSTAFGAAALASLYEVACAPIITPAMERMPVDVLFQQGPIRGQQLGQWSERQHHLTNGRQKEAIELAVHLADGLRRIRRTLGDRDFGIIQRVLDNDPLQGMEDERADEPAEPGGDRGDASGTTIPDGTPPQSP